MLEGSNLVQEYDGTRILNGISITVHAGAVTVLIGKSGSGKSTLLRTLSLIDPPQHGTIRLGERQLFPSPTTLAYWPEITAVFQQFVLWPHVSVRRNILLPATLRRKPVERAEPLCTELGIDGTLERFPHQISVGQRQRAALARAILLRPQFLLLDEITSAQDVQHVSQILRVLSDAVTAGLGLLVVTHHLGFAKRLLSVSERSLVVFIQDGVVVETGPSHLLDAPESSPLREYIALSHTLR